MEPKRPKLDEPGTSSCNLSRKRPLKPQELEQLIDEDPNDSDIVESDESEQGNFTEYEDDKSETSVPSDDDDDSPMLADPTVHARRVMYSKNTRKWYLDSLHAINSRTRQKNLVTHLPGPKGDARGVVEPKRIWNLFFSDVILDKIVKCTNDEIERKNVKYKSKQWYIGPTTPVEINALFGLLYLSGVLKNPHVTLNDLWSPVFGPVMFRSTMNKNRFEFIINCLRFDEKETREERKKSDKFAAVREIWEIFERGCRKNYTPSEYVTVDETLLGFRGRCPFKMYIPSKPDKYGLKVVTMCDAKTYYMCSAKPYIGKEERHSPYSIPTQYVLDLTKEIHGTNRNCTTDNWFTSYELAEKLLEKKITLVGTMRKNKTDIPKQLVEAKGKLVNSSLFVFDENCTLVSFVPKKNKTVVLLSSMHDQAEVDDETKKPQIILFYNETKGGVDTFDQLCHLTTVARKTRRWPLRILYAMLDTAGVNSYVIYKCNWKENKVQKRSDFLKNLSFSLVEEHLKSRVHNRYLPREMKNNIRAILKCNETEDTEELPVNPMSRCAICPRKTNRKARHRCEHCHKGVCGEHRSSICIDCK